MEISRLRMEENNRNGRLGDGGGVKNFWVMSSPRCGKREESGTSFPAI